MHDACHCQGHGRRYYLANDIKALPALARWLFTGDGPLSSNVGEAAAFIRLTGYNFPQTVNPPKDFTSAPMAPDLELIGAVVDEGPRWPSSCWGEFVIVTE